MHHSRFKIVDTLYYHRLRLIRRSNYAVFAKHFNNSIRKPFLTSLSLVAEGVVWSRRGTCVPDANGYSLVVGSVMSNEDF